MTLEHSGDAVGAARRAFARVQGVPTFSPATFHGGRRGAPTLSCVVVLNQNGAFVRDRLLPSLAACTRDVPFEAIVVCNGDVAFEAPEGVRCVRAPEYGCVAGAYNAGVAASRGRYVALFHDDCLLHDAAWAPRMMASSRFKASGRPSTAAERRVRSTAPAATVPGNSASIKGTARPR